MTYIATIRDPATLRSAIERSLRAEAASGLPDLAPDEAAVVGHLSRLRARLQARILEPSALLEQEAAALALMEEVIAELSEKTRRCPVCRHLSESVFNCEHCGAAFGNHRARQEGREV